MVKVVKDTIATPNATVLYKKCAGCHGAKGEKVALGKSQIIKGWDSVKITDALKGYKAGTYGGAMKGLMKSQVSSMSDKEIETLSTLISTF
ncbi:MAG: cytochrome c [Arcobacteraceae bacterium]|nr:cytochrome c [Arcobacteraceae bacterium]